MIIRKLWAGILVAAAGCVTMPQGPSVAVMPGPGKPFDMFVAEDAVCQRFAAEQVHASPQDEMNKNVAADALTGAAIGAAAGTAIGAVAGNTGVGAVVGAGTGMFEGSMVGIGAGQRSSWNIQQRYNIAYEQCMYAKGNQVPGFSGGYAYPPPVNMPPPSKGRY